MRRLLLAKAGIAAGLLAALLVRADANLLQMPFTTGPAGPVNNTAPNITPTTGIALSTVLTCNTGTWTPSTGNTYTYQFFRDASSIAAPASGNTYTVASADEGHSITCTQIATNGGTTTSPPSNGVAVPGIPVNTAAPAITPTTAAGTGVLLTCSTGTWTQSPTSYAYTFYRDGSTSIATTSTYTTATADQGHSITCVTTATNSIGTSAASPASNAVTVPPPAVTPTVVQHLVDTTATGALTHSITPFSGNVTSGNVVVVGFFACKAAGCSATSETIGITSIAHTRGPACTRFTGNVLDGAATKYHIEQWYCDVTSTGADSITVTLTSSQGGLSSGAFWAAEWSGVVASSDDGVGNGATASSGTAMSVSTTAATSQASNQPLVSIFGSDASITPGTGMTALDCNGTVCSWYSMSSSAAVQTNTGTSSTSAVWLALIAAMKHQ